MAEKKPADGLEMPTRPVYAKLVSLANMRDNSPSSLVKVAQLARVSLAQNYLDGYNNQVDEPKKLNISWIYLTNPEGFSQREQS